MSTAHSPNAHFQTYLTPITLAPPGRWVVKMGACMLDLAAHRLYGSDGGDIPLTSMEFDLLKTFAAHPDRVLSRNQLLEFAHHRSAAPFDRSIDLRIMRLRKKIETDPEDPQVLKTIRGVGYLFASGRKR